MIAIGDHFWNGDRDKKVDQDRDQDRDRNFRDRGHALFKSRNPPWGWVDNIFFYHTTLMIFFDDVQVLPHMDPRNREHRENNDVGLELD